MWALTARQHESLFNDKQERFVLQVGYDEDLPNVMFVHFTSGATENLYAKV